MQNPVFYGAFLAISWIRPRSAITNYSERMRLNSVSWRLRHGASDTEDCLPSLPVVARKEDTSCRSVGILVSGKSNMAARKKMPDTIGELVVVRLTSRRFGKFSHIQIHYGIRRSSWLQKGNITSTWNKLWNLARKLNSPVKEQLSSYESCALFNIYINFL